MRFLNFLGIIGLLFALASCSNSQAEYQAELAKYEASVYEASLETCGYDLDCVYWTTVKHVWEEFEGPVPNSEVIFTKAELVDKVAYAEIQFPSSTPKTDGEKMLDGIYDLLCDPRKSTDDFAQTFFHNGGVFEFDLIDASGEIYLSRRITSCDEPE